MLLSAQSIRERCLARDPDYMIWPFYERRVTNGLSYGLSSAGYDIRVRENLYLAHGDFSLASSEEKFCIPNDLLMRIVDKSTWARRGICVQNTVAEPGWKGYLTLEITNHAKRAVRINAGSPIAQVLFELLDQPTENPYKGKYQYQPANAVEAIHEW